MTIAVFGKNNESTDAYIKGAADNTATFEKMHNKFSQDRIFCNTRVKFITLPAEAKRCHEYYCSVFLNSKIDAYRSNNFKENIQEAKYKTCENCYKNIKTQIAQSENDRTMKTY